MAEPTTVVEELAAHVEQRRETIWQVCRRYEEVGLKAVEDAPRPSHVAEGAAQRGRLVALHSSEAWPRGTTALGPSGRVPARFEARRKAGWTASAKGLAPAPGIMLRRHYAGEA